MPAPLNVTRLALTVLSICGNKEATHKLRLDKLRRAEAEVFIASLRPDQRRLPKKKLRHMFQRKFPNQTPPL